MVNEAKIQRLCFGEFEADLQSQELFKDGQRVALPNQSFLALSALLERPGQLVTREELRARLWPDKRVVEFEQGLNAIINRLRDTLGDSAESARFIETLPKRGYKFRAAVRPACAAAPARHLPYIGIGAALLLGLVALLAFQFFKTATSSYTKVEPLTSLVGREVSPSWSPDGGTLLYAWNGDLGSDAKFDLFAKHANSERVLKLTHHPAEAISAAWSPNGSLIAFTRMDASRAGGLYVMPSRGGGETQLAGATFLEESFMPISWSSRGDLIAYSATASQGRSVIQLLAFKDKTQRTLASPADCLDAGAPTFSHDAQSLAYFCTHGVALYGIYLANVASGISRLLGTLQGYPKGVTWSADGEALLLANEAGDGSALWRMTLKGQMSRLPVTEESIGPGIAVSGGRIAYVREQHPLDIWRMELANPADPGQLLISSTRTQLVPQYSPDGTHIAFQSSRSGSSEIWLAQADGHDPVRLTHFNGPLTGAPSWCSDGRRLAFDSRASGNSDIYVIDILEGLPRRIEAGRVALAMPVWSADCRWLLASDGRTALYRVPSEGGAARLFSKMPSYRAEVAGSRVIFNVVDASGVTLWAKTVDGDLETRLAGIPQLQFSNSWAAQVNGVFFTESRGGDTVVSYYDFATGQSHVLRSLPLPAALGGLGICVSPDGRWLIWTRTRDWQSDIMMIS